MVSIYCIEDINDLKYIGSTTQKLFRRLQTHKKDKRRGHPCSSSKLHLEHSIMYELERCPENERKERERYWINNTDCVNTYKLNFDRREYKRSISKNNLTYLF